MHPDSPVPDTVAKLEDNAIVLMLPSFKLIIKALAGPFVLIDDLICKSPAPATEPPYILIPAYESILRATIVPPTDLG